MEGVGGMVKGGGVGGMRWRLWEGYDGIYTNRATNSIMFEKRSGCGRCVMLP